jgi:hypothetical protein
MDWRSIWHEHRRVRFTCADAAPQGSSPPQWMQNFAITNMVPDFVMYSPESGSSCQTPLSTSLFVSKQLHEEGGSTVITGTQMDDNRQM